MERLVEAEVQGDGTQLVGLKEAYFAFRVGGLIALLNQAASSYKPVSSSSIQHEIF